MSKKKSFKRFAYLKVEDILAAVQENEHKQSIDDISKVLRVSKGVT